MVCKLSAVTSHWQQIFFHAKWNLLCTWRAVLTGLASIPYLMIFWAPGKGLCCALLAGSWHVFKLVLRIITYSAVIFNSIAISNKKMCLSKLIQSSTARTWHCLLAGDHILVALVKLVIRWFSLNLVIGHLPRPLRQWNQKYVLLLFSGMLPWRGFLEGNILLGFSLGHYKMPFQADYIWSSVVLELAQIKQNFEFHTLHNLVLKLLPPICCSVVSHSLALLCRTLVIRYSLQWWLILDPILSLWATALNQDCRPADWNTSNEAEATHESTIDWKSICLSNAMCRALVTVCCSLRAASVLSPAEVGDSYLAHSS